MSRQSSETKHESRVLTNTRTLAADGQLTADQVRGVALVLNATWVDPWVGGVGSLISQTGSWAALAAAVFAAAALWLARAASWPALLLLVAFGWQLEISHASPRGPIAFTLLIAAALWLRWTQGRLPPGERTS